MASFEKAFAKTIKAEGGYVNNPNDKGGETYMGITRKNHPNLKLWIIVDNAKSVDNSKEYINHVLKHNLGTIDEIKEVYKKNYWNSLKLDDINSQPVANQFFDISVNCGVRSAIKTMQRVAGVKETGRMNTQTIDYYVKKYKRKS